MDKQREAFEAWFKRGQPCRTDDGYFQQYGDGEYVMWNMQLAFEAWQAAQQAQESNKLLWLPIETAPRDKERRARILIFSERHGVREARFYREDSDGVEWFDTMVGGGPSSIFYDATHWMPLPPAP